jgi:hypothetical protein
MLKGQTDDRGKAQYTHIFKYWHMKTDHMMNKLLHIESVERNKHPMQVMKEYYYINMGS